MWAAGWLLVCDDFFRPSGADGEIDFLTHSLRCGLHSFAALRLCGRRLYVGRHRLRDQNQNQKQRAGHPLHVPSKDDRRECLYAASTVDMRQGSLRHSPQGRLFDWRVARTLNPPRSSHCGCPALRAVCEGRERWCRHYYFLHDIWVMARAPCDLFFRPSGADGEIDFLTHSLRCGLHSFAALRLCGRRLYVGRHNFEIKTKIKSRGRGTGSTFRRRREYLYAASAVDMR